MLVGKESARLQRYGVVEADGAARRFILRTGGRVSHDVVAAACRCRGHCHGRNRQAPGQRASRLGTSLGRKAGCACFGLTNILPAGNWWEWVESGLGSSLRSKAITPWAARRAGPVNCLKFAITANCTS